MKTTIQLHGALFFLALPLLSLQMGSHADAAVLSNTANQAVIADFIPNDPGQASTAGGWQDLQWNFLAAAGVNAPAAWANMARLGKPGGKGVVVAVIDTGVAYRNYGKFKKAPDLPANSFVAGWDFIGDDPYPLDQNGHGTHVAGTILEHTNNGADLTGLSFGVKVMPIRALDSIGQGEASIIAAAIRLAAKRGAKIINLSVQFDESVKSKDIPQIYSAIDYADKLGSVIIAASGNTTSSKPSLPARASKVIAVGATTEDLCLASYSNEQPDIVAPGGGRSRAIENDPSCHANSTENRAIYQQSFRSGELNNFFLDPQVGTSMAAPHVAAAAAMIVASKLIGKNPKPSAIEKRLEETARDLGPPGTDSYFGAGLLDAAAATR